MKQEKGAITLYVTVLCLFILLTGIIAYVGTSNRQTTQLSTIQQIEEQYNKGTQTAEDLYQQYVGGDIVPIYTPEQFALIGSGKDVYIEQNGKIYTFNTNKTYIYYGAPEKYDSLLANLADDIKSEVLIYP